VKRVQLREAADFLALLPEDCPEVFTNRELASRLRIGIRTARQLSYCLRAVGGIGLRGKRGREYLFARTG
jgi:hypothetical protein